MKRSILLSPVILCLLAGSARAEFTVGAEYGNVSRTVELRSFSADSSSGDTLAVFAGVDLENSMFYLKYLREETQLADTPRTYEKRAVTLDWHWNETNTKGNNFSNTSLGIFHTPYNVSPAMNADFAGLSLGGGLTRSLVHGLFFNIRGKAHVMFGDDDDLLPAQGSDEAVFFGYEAQTALGYQFGSKVSWSVQLGYRLQEIDFDERFYDDSSHGFFLVARYFTLPD